MDGAQQHPVGLPAALGEGRYRLESRLGSGGMALVFRGTDTALQRPVAVKLLGDVLAADEQARTRFEREARATAGVAHPNVIQVFDVREDVGRPSQGKPGGSGRPFIVMELVEGPSLAECVEDEGPLAPSRVVEIARDVLQGLRAAHDGGLLHRDVKPANLLQAPDGTVKITDFGIATAADAPGLTQTGMVLGTAGYLPPERRRGEQATPRTDLYGLGASLYALLTGRPPPEDRAPSLPPGTPARLEALVRACLAEEPADRPASAEQALRLLDGRDRATTEELTADQPVPGEPADHAPTRPTAAAAGVSLRPRWLRARWLRARWRRIALVAAVAGAAAVLALQTGLGGDLWGAGGGGGAAAPDSPVRPADDPAETAERLSDWLRERAGG